MKTKSINCLIKSVDVVSFDVFDTLLLRPVVKPKDVWQLVGGQEFCHARAAADRGGFDTVDDAYFLIDDQWKSHKEEELRVEREILIANQEMLSVWNEAGRQGKKRIIASDMYLPRGFLEDVLRKNGFDNWDYFYLSCDCKARKDTGSMYELMLKDLRIEPSRILHIGDNVASDIEKAREYGIQVFRVSKHFDDFLARFPFVSNFLEANPSLPARCLMGAISAFWKNYSYRHPDYSYWSQIGAVFGGAFCSIFILHIINSAKNKGIDRLFFVARDGYSLEKICNRLAPEIKTNYVYAPRYIRATNDPQLSQEYNKYAHGLNASEDKVAVVDTITGSFTSQWLLSRALGRSVYGIFAIGLKKPENGELILYAPNNKLRWFHFIEMLCMAPTPPVFAVKNGQPVYQSPVPEHEQFKIKIYPELSDAEVDSAVHISSLAKALGISLDIELWMDLMDAFLEGMTYEDQAMFNRILNGNDIAHTEYVPIFKPSQNKRILTKRFLIPYKLHVEHRRGKKWIIEKRNWFKKRTISFDL